ncbi:MAG: phospholipid-binding protein MlaC [Rhodospirillaceae bacterium]
MKNRLVAVLLACACWAAQPSIAADMAPDALAKSVTDEVLEAVRADKDLQSGNSQKVLQLVEAKVLPHFNFTRMTQLAMGKNWRQAQPEQQKALVNEFRTLLVRTYTAAFSGYKNQTIDYRPLKLAPTDTDATVKSVINQPGAQPIAVDYSMEKTGQGWKVYDVKIEGISLVDNYRSTFNTEVQKNGVDGLIKALADKNKSFTQARASAK